jgi:predicted class III extradiol MEMO1 family dioxygenase
LKSPYGDLKVSDLNAEIMAQLPKSSYLVHNDMQELEHSLEAIIPFTSQKQEPTNYSNTGALYQLRNE